MSCKAVVLSPHWQTHLEPALRASSLLPAHCKGLGKQLSDDSAPVRLIGGYPRQAFIGRSHTVAEPRIEPAGPAWKRDRPEAAADA